MYSILAFILSILVFILKINLLSIIIFCIADKSVKSGCVVNIAVSHMFNSVLLS